MSLNLKCKSVLVVVVFVFGSAVYGQPWAGSGTEGDPYLIYTAEDMQAIGADANYWDAHFKLMSDIDLGAYTGTSFNIIGYYEGWGDPDNEPFTGVFDGGGHTISNFTYELNGIGPVFYIGIGLFRHIEDPNAEIKNLGLIDPNIHNVEGGLCVGSLAGVLVSGTISDCYVEGVSVTGEEGVGGLVGVNGDGSIISNCYSAGSVDGNHSVGGLVAINYGGDISDCYSAGSVTGEIYVGGLVGWNWDDSSISDCYSTCSVTGGGYVGGLVGHNNGSGIVSGSYSSGSVLGNDYVGGLVGLNYGGDIQGCYSTGGVTGNIWVGGLVGENEGGISNSYSEGIVTGGYSVGGLVGSNGHGSSIANCYSQGSVDGNGYVGGLVGSNNGEITNCYSTGSVTGNEDVGGLIGDGSMSSIYVTDSFWDVNSSGQIISDGGEGKTTEQMQDVVTFAVWLCEETEVWTIDDGNDYPRLVWENKPGGLLQDVLYCGGNGTESEPYLIYTANQLNTIGLLECNLDKHFKLMADIDMSEYTGISFNIIGNDVNAFTGVFDGNGHAISNFTYDCNGYHGRGVGLFGYIDDPNAEVKDLGLMESNVNAGDWFFDVGALVGHLENGSINNCYVKGGSLSGRDFVGGLVGMMNKADISNCYSSSSVSGISRIGGLVGGNSGDVSSCYSKASVTGEDYIGGLMGANVGDIMNCYSQGSVSGDSYVGGLVGGNDSEVSDCYSSGSVAGDVNVGGLVGQDYNGDYTGCFWDSDVNPDVNGIGNGDEPNVVGLPTVLMQTESTFTDAGWDFVGEVINGPNDIWDICEGTNYPKLVWSIPAGDFICPDGVNMLDFAILGDAWFSDPNMGNWDPACDISEPNDNIIDGLDLEVFAGNWLEGIQ